MTYFEEVEKPEQPSAIPIVIGLLGAGGVIGAYFLVPGFQILELFLLFVVVGFVTRGTRENIIRGVATVIILYLSSAIAAVFYPVLQPYSESILQLFTLVGVSTSPYDALAVSFIALMAVVWIAMEVLTRSTFPNTRLPALGFLDTLGGVLLYLGIGIVVATLLFSAIGYSRQRAHNNARLRPKFNQVLLAYYRTQSFLLTGNSPAIYTYDLNLSSES